MAHRITGKKQIGDEVFWAEVEAPLIARARRPGQFIILSIDTEHSERIPLTIAGADPEKGTIELIWQRVGKTTAQLADLSAGDEIANVAGPLGTPTHIENFGTVVCIGGGIGNAPLLPIAAALKQAGNTVISILGARDKSHLEFDVPTQVSLNTIMVDGTGMCGGCRVEVDGKPKFVCVDGPEFDGHKVNFDLMMKRMGAYKNQEKQAYEKYKQHRCRIGLDK